MISGKIETLIYNHNDDVDGWQMSDGTLVHFPPHIGEELGLWIGEGDDVLIDGESRINRNGATVVFPNYVESQGWSLEFEQKRGPKHRPGSHESDDHDEHPGKVSNEDLMRELKAIRRLLEAWR